VDVRVFDGDGRFVPTLEKEDFEVFERGVRQPIESIELVGYRNPLLPRGARPALARGRPTDPHTWIFQFDRKHLSAGQFARVRTAVELFIEERFIDGDIAGIVDGDKMVFDKISSSRAELLAAIRRIKPSGEQASRESDKQYAENFGGVEIHRGPGRPREPGRRTPSRRWWPTISSATPCPTSAPQRKMSEH
jgi:hypothetical protein